MGKLALLVGLLALASCLIPQVSFEAEVTLVEPPTIYFSGGHSLTVSPEDLGKFTVGFRYRVTAHQENGVWVIDSLKNLSLFEVRIYAIMGA